MDRNFIRQINSYEDSMDTTALENSLEWLEANPHGLQDVEARKNYVRSAIDSVLCIKSAEKSQKVLTQELKGI